MMREEAKLEEEKNRAIRDYTSCWKCWFLTSAAYTAQTGEFGSMTQITCNP